MPHPMVWKKTNVMKGDASTTITFPKKKKRKTPSNAQIIRELRAEAAGLESKRDELSSVWQSVLPLDHIRDQAIQAARAKRELVQSEKLYRDLVHLSLNQQLILASAQQLVSQSPIQNAVCPKEIFHRLHSSLHLKVESDDASRQETLSIQCEVMLRIIASGTDRLSSDHIPETTFDAPYSSTELVQDGKHSIVSNILLFKLPNYPIEDVYRAVHTYIECLPKELDERLGLQFIVESEEVMSPHMKYSNCLYKQDGEISARMLRLVAGSIHHDSAVIAVDFADSDEMLGIDNEDIPRLEPLFGLLITREYEGQDPYILMRRVSVKRYNIQFNAVKLHREVEALNPVINGDLLVEVVCKELAKTSGREVE